MINTMKYAETQVFNSVANITPLAHKMARWKTHQPSLPQSQHGGQHPTTQAHTEIVGHHQETLIAKKSTTQLK